MSEKIYNKEKHPIEVIQLMSEGKSRVQCAAYWGIAKCTFDDWVTDPNRPEFGIAYKIAKTAFEGYQEDIGQKGMKGLIKGFSYPAWAKIMGTRCKDEWSEVVQQKIELMNSVQKMSNTEIDNAIAVFMAQKNNNNNNSGSPIGA